MKIEDFNYGIIAGGEIHLDLKKGLFRLQFGRQSIPPEYQFDDPPTSTSLTEMREAAREYAAAQIERLSFRKQILILAFSSTAPQMEKETDWNKPNHEKLSRHAHGMAVSYMVANEYTFKYHAYVGQNQVYENGSGFPKLVKRYDWREKTVYLFERGDEPLQIGHGYYTEYHQFTQMYEATHKMDYSEEAEKFIVDTIKALDAMIDRVSTFFNSPSESLLEKLKTAGQLLIT